MSEIQLLNGDCLELMKEIPSGSVDLILTDPPYGTIEGMKIKNWEHGNRWDKKIDAKVLFPEFERILRVNGKAIVFSQEPYTTELKNNTNNIFTYSYDLIWNKLHFASPFSVNKKPLNDFEMISVFTKIYDTELTHPLRKIAKEIMNKNNIKSLREVNKKLNNRKMEHFFYVDTQQFSLCSKSGWEDFCKYYDNCGYTYQQLKELNKKYENTFNITNGNSEKSILTYKKESKRYHPTQKPVALLEHLIKMYSNENNLIVDCFMGSGSTGVACKNTDRNFIGIELNEEYFNIAKERIKNE